MKKTGNILFFCLIAIFSFSVALAQTNELKVSVSKNPVAVNEQFKLTFTLNNSGSRFTAPDLSGLRVYSGPNQSSSMQWVNGRSSSSQSFSYIVSARNEGKLTIGAASIVVNGETISSEPLTIQVTKAVTQSAPQSTNKQRQQSSNAQQTQSANIEENIFLKAFVNKRNVYVNEQVVVTYKIFTRLSIVENNITKTPNFNGFLAKNVELPSNAQLSTEIFNGVQYNVATLKQTVLFPQKSGKLTIDNMSMDVTVRVRDNSRQRSIFDSFFGGFRDIALSLESNDFQINVSPLPEPKPQGFNGAVGDFKISSTIDKNEVVSNEAINLVLSISGSGNVDYLDKLPFNFPADFEVYDPKINTKSTANGNGLSGKQVFEYLLIPRHSGNFSIPSCPFVYFNPETKTYNTLNTENFNIKVNRAPGEESQPMYSAQNRSELKVIGKDIRFIANDSGQFETNEELLFKSRMYYMLNLLPLLGVVLILLLFDRFMKTVGDSTASEAKYKAKLASKYLKDAQVDLKNKNSRAFYANITKGLYAFIATQLSMEQSEMTKVKIADNLMKAKVDQSLISQFKILIEKCEMANYAPMAEADMDAIYQEASQIMQQIQKQVKK